jgi:MoxR-like ATPase
MPSLSSGVTVALRLAGFEARNDDRAMGLGHLLLALSWISDESMSARFDDPQKQYELADEGARLRERFAEAGIDPDELRKTLRAALAAQERPDPHDFDGLDDALDDMGGPGGSDGPGGRDRSDRSDGSDGSDGSPRSHSSDHSDSASRPTSHNGSSSRDKSTHNGSPRGGSGSGSNSSSGSSSGRGSGSARDSSARDSSLMYTIRRAGELGERNHAGVIELLRAILEQPLPHCREVFEMLGVDEPLYAFFPEISRPAPEPSPDAPDPSLNPLLDSADSEVSGDSDVSDDSENVGPPDLFSDTDTDSIASLSDDELDALTVERTTRVPRRPRHAVGEPRTPLLDRFGRDLTFLARQAALPPLIGREQEMLSLARVLVRQRKANAVLVGEAGVGKTGIVEGLAARLASEAAPKDLANVRIVELTMSAMVAGTKYRGEFEERMEAVLKEARETPGVILFLDELHTVLGAGAATGATDAASILKPMLARGEIRVIGATTAGEYQRYVEEDPALQRRFAVIWVEEPTRAEAVEILQGVAEHMKQHHRVEIAEDAPAAAVELAIRYLPEHHLPDKAIDLLDQACAVARIPSLTLPPAVPTPPPPSRTTPACTHVRHAPRHAAPIPTGHLPDHHISSAYARRIPRDTTSTFATHLIHYVAPNSAR